jgi:hypothetical protein
MLDDRDDRAYMLKSYVRRSGAKVTSSNSTALITVRAQL